MDWNALNATRRSWQPNNPTSIQTLAPKTISRCLALTKLEPAVADFIRDGLDRVDRGKLGDAAIATLQRNIEDEEKHELALTRAKDAMIDYDNSFEAEAQQLIDGWRELFDPEILKAAVMENSFFFPMLALYANFGGSALTITANSISGDERIHVITHRKAAEKLGVRPSKRINELRKASIRFISEDLESEVGPRWTVNRMMKNSESLLQRGISDMIETQASMAIAPFETNSQNLDIYQ